MELLLTNSTGTDTIDFGSWVGVVLSALTMAGS